MTINEIKKRLNDMSGNNPEFYQKLTPGAKKCLGVRVPNLRLLAKEIAKDDYKKFLKENPMDTMEEELLSAMVIGYAKDDIDVLLKCFEEFIPNIHDWCVNDTLSSTFKCAKKYQKETFDMLLKHKKAKKEFEIRIVVAMLMDHFNNDEYIDRAFDLTIGFKSNDYYANMGVAWALATFAYKYPKKVYDYMKSEECSLNDFTFNKTISKIKESFRVSDVYKNKFDKLKK